MKTFYLPDLGEGLPEGEITKWHVKAGDIVHVDNPLVSIETAKAIVEIPSPYDGKIVKLYAKEGEIVPTGGALVDFETEQKQEASTVAGEIKVGNEIVSEKLIAVSKSSVGLKVLPAVRALAKKLNVDLTTITPSGSDGTVSMDDVKKASATLIKAGPLEPLRGTRRAMSQVMALSHAEVVPVTIMEDIHIRSGVENKDLTVNMISAIVKACNEEPALNGWFDSQNVGRRLFKDVHIGIAMDTKEGLFVPVIHCAQDKSPVELRNEIEILKKEVIERTLKQEKLQGATITLSNFGKFTGRYASPIVVPPTLAILAVGAYRKSPIVDNNEISIGTVLPLSLTFDHRAVTGGEASRFLKVIIDYFDIQK